MSDSLYKGNPLVKASFLNLGVILAHAISLLRGEVLALPPLRDSGF